MRKLLPLMVGVALAVGSVAPAFAQEPQKQDDEGGKKKGKKKKGGEEPKKDLR